MDIAFWIEPTMLAGEASFLRHLITGLKAEGQEITLICPEGLSLAHVPVLGSRVLTYRWNRWERLPVLQKLRLNRLGRQLNDAPPDVLVAWGSAESSVTGIAGWTPLGGSGALAVIAQIAPAIPLVLWCWDASELFSPLTRLPTLRHIVASSQAIASRLGDSRRSHDGAPVPMTVVHPGVYCEETLACFDVPGQIPCLVSLDPLSNRGAYEALLKACRKLADRRDDFLVFAYDQGSAEYPIWLMAERLNLLDRFNFVPFQQDAEPLLLHGDLYIHIVPSARVQYRTLEAMGRGLAIVTCPNHGADHLIDGETCRIVGPQTPEAWCKALQDLVEDRPRTAAIARRGQQYVQEHHSMARTLEQFGSICRQAAGMAIPMTR
jgi:glycosyltransferase involved in cell wall biosynthesis